MIEEFKYVVDNSKYVKINNKKINEFINNLDSINYVHWSKEFNLDLNEKEWIILATIVESMNFCFWMEPKWKIEYKGNLIGGSNALFYTIVKQVEKDKNFLKIDNLEKIDKNIFNKIFEGKEGVCPFLDKRYNNFKEVVNVLKDDNFFNKLFSITNNTELLKFIVDNISSFNDKSVYKGKVIHFYKRATLLTNDYYQLSSTIRNNIKDVNNLSGCADYGIPRTFRDYGILVYSNELANMVDNKIEIPHDSEYEIEIRGNMLYVIELIKKKLKDKSIIVNSVELDSIIWNMGKKMTNRSNSHHTVTIYY